MQYSMYNLYLISVVVRKRNTMMAIELIVPSTTISGNSAAKAATTAAIAEIIAYQIVFDLYQFFIVNSYL